MDWYRLAYHPFREWSAPVLFHMKTSYTILTSISFIGELHDTRINDEVDAIERSDLYQLPPKVQLHLLQLVVGHGILSASRNKKKWSVLHILQPTRAYHTEIEDP